jgi:DNA-binding NtrC family response regulator
MPTQILIVEDNENLRHDVQKTVTRGAPHRQIVTARNEFEAKQLIEKIDFDVVVTDIKLDEAGGTETGGLRVLQAVHKKDRTTPVIVVTAYGKKEILTKEDSDIAIASVEDAVKQMGAFAYIARPHPTMDYLDAIYEAVTRALEHRASNLGLGHG